jgi:hypothetical protein
MASSTSSTRRPGKVRKKAVKVAKGTVAGYRKYRSWGGVTNHLLGDYTCTLCEVPRQVPNRHRKFHDVIHGGDGRRPVKLTNVLAHPPRPTAAPAPAPPPAAKPPPVRRPSKTKTAERDSRRPARPARPARRKTRNPSNTAAWKAAITRGARDGSPGTNMSDANARMVRVILSAGHETPTTVDEAQAHLVGLSSVIKALATHLEDEVQALVKAKWHPDVVAALQRSAETVSGAQMGPTEVYRQFLRRYEPQITAGNQAGDEQVPDMFKSKGA